MARLQGDEIHILEGVNTSTLFFSRVTIDNYMRLKSFMYILQSKNKRTTEWILPSFDEEPKSDTQIDVQKQANKPCDCMCSEF